MSRSVACFAVIAVLLATGCAPAETKESEETYKAPVYRTGSNLPAGRESGEPSSRELSAAERRLIEDIERRPRQPIGQTK